MELLEYLYNNVNKSKNTIKNLLRDGYVFVNGKSITKYNYNIKETDKVEIRNKINNIDIVYEDKNIIVVNKPYNLLTISTKNEKEKTLYHMVSDYVKSKNKKDKIFIVHRLDKDTSGLVVMAKNEIIKNKLQNKWNNVNREYIAIVSGNTIDKGIIKTNLEEKNNRVFVSTKGSLAITEYKKIKSNDKYTMLNIIIKTGRKHQIRVHLNSIGHPIIGDNKYGDIKSKRMMLHAYKLEFVLYNKKYSFKIDYPLIFKQYLN